MKSLSRCRSCGYLELAAAKGGNFGLEQFLRGAGVQLLKPGQYMDKWRLDRNGVKPIENAAVKRALGFSNVQAFPR